MKPADGKSKQLRAIAAKQVAKFFLVAGKNFLGYGTVDVDYTCHALPYLPMLIIRRPMTIYPSLGPIIIASGPITCPK